MRKAYHRSVLVVVLTVVVSAVAGAAYVVKPGDTLSQIAARNDTTIRELVALNKIANPDLIRVGQSLEIPGQTEPAAPPATTVPGTDETATYVVKAGDTLGRIAVRNATTVKAIVEANGLANPNLIRVGQRLTLPRPAASIGDTAPTPPPTPVDSPGPVEAPTTHVVQWGETLGSIAARYGITVETLREANGITGNLIFAGTTLRLVIENEPPPAPASTTHTVEYGETLGDVAARFGTTVAAIVAANDLADPNTIVAGTVLVIPSSSWVCPVPGGTFFNDWGFPRSGGRFHEGNDIFAPRGTEVLAPVAGKVSQNTGPVGGNQVKLAGADGILYIATHLDGFGADGVVKAGDVIGYVGDSGNAKGGRTHLHFEMHPGNGAAVNPYPTLSENCG